MANALQQRHENVTPLSSSELVNKRQQNQQHQNLVYKQEQNSQQQNLILEQQQFHHQHQHHQQHQHQQHQHPYKQHQRHLYWRSPENTAFTQQTQSQQLPSQSSNRNSKRHSAKNPSSTTTPWARASPPSKSPRGAELSRRRSLPKYRSSTLETPRKENYLIEKSSPDGKVSYYKQRREDEWSHEGRSPVKLRAETCPAKKRGSRGRDKSNRDEAPSLRAVKSQPGITSYNVEETGGLVKAQIYRGRSNSTHAYPTNPNVPMLANKELKVVRVVDDHPPPAEETDMSPSRRRKVSLKKLGKSLSHKHVGSRKHVESTLLQPGIRIVYKDEPASPTNKKTKSRLQYSKSTEVLVSFSGQGKQKPTEKETVKEKEKETVKQKENQKTDHEKEESPISKHRGFSLKGVEVPEKPPAKVKHRTPSKSTITKHHKNASEDVSSVRKSIANSASERTRQPWGHTRSVSDTIKSLPERDSPTVRARSPSDSSNISTSKDYNKLSECNEPY